MMPCGPLDLRYSMSIFTCVPLPAPCEPKNSTVTGFIGLDNSLISRKYLAAKSQKALKILLPNCEHRNIAKNFGTKKAKTIPCYQTGKREDNEESYIACAR